MLLADTLLPTGGAQQTADQHQEPIRGGNRSGNGLGIHAAAQYVQVGILQPFLQHVGNTHLDTYINEDRDGTHDKVTERQRAVFRSLGGLFAVLLLVLRNFRQADYDEGEGEDGQRGVHQREYVADLRVLDALGNQQTRQDNHGRTASELNEPPA